MTELKDTINQVSKGLEIFETVIMIKIRGDVSETNPPFELIKQKLLNHYIGGKGPNYEYEIRNGMNRT